MVPQLSPQFAEESPAIPDRLYFKIGDVARLCGLEPYVLRFWESQFPQLKPNKSGTGQRLYRRRDVEMVIEIKRLVHGQGFTLAGARQALDAQGRSKSRQQPELVSGGAAAAKPRQDLAAALGRMRAELLAIASLLTAPAARPQRRRSRLAAVASGELFPS
ncbi:MAG: MerR family transcriptional regulator [Acidobacteriota bacterium]